MKALMRCGCILLASLSICTSVNGQILNEACDFDSTCIDLRVSSATSGDQVVSKTYSGSLDNQRVFGHGDLLVPLPLELSPDDGFSMDAWFGDPSFMNIDISGSQTILPTDQSNDPSRISGVVLVRETVEYFHPRLGGFQAGIGYTPRGSGEFRLPEVLSPGFMSVDITWDIQSVVNGNLVLTPLFSVSLNVTEQEPFLTVSGRDLDFISFNSPAPDLYGWGAQASQGSPSEFQVREGEPFEIIGTIFYSIDVDAYESTGPDDYPWRFSFEDIGLQLAGPEGGDFFSIPDSADFDNDGDEDGNDFLAWQRGESPDPLSAMELATWKALYGTAPLRDAVTSTGVPEPSTGIMLLMVIAGLLTDGRTLESKRI